MGRAARATQERIDQPEQVALLRGMWHAFGSEPDRESLLQASERWIEAALRGEVIAVRFVVLDARGRLNSVYGSHEGIWGDPGLRRARLAIEAKTPRRGVTRTFGGARILSVPLVTRGSALGAVEIATTSPMGPDRRDLVEAVVSQTAVALANLEARALHERGLVSMRSAIELGVEIAGAESREEAIRGLVRGLYRDLQLRSAGWLVDASGVRAGGDRRTGLATPRPHATCRRGRTRRRRAASHRGLRVGPGRRWGRGRSRAAAPWCCRSRRATPRSRRRRRRSVASRANGWSPGPRWRAPGVGSSGTGPPSR